MKPSKLCSKNTLLIFRNLISYRGSVLSNSETLPLLPLNYDEIALNNLLTIISLELDLLTLALP